ADRGVAYADAVDRDLAGVGEHQAEDALHQRRLARGVRADDRRDLARLERGRDAPQHLESAEALPQGVDDDHLILPMSGLSSSIALGVRTGRRRSELSFTVDSGLRSSTSACGYASAVSANSLTGR